MLAKVLTSFRGQVSHANSGAILNFTKRGAYTAGQEPKVFVNKNTRVLCQGITGKHVSNQMAISCLYLYYLVPHIKQCINIMSIHRVPSTPSRLLPTAPRW